MLLQRRALGMDAECKPVSTATRRYVTWLGCGFEWGDRVGRAEPGVDKLDGTSASWTTDSGTEYHGDLVRFASQSRNRCLRELCI
jgi:hypothetical protein